MSLTSILKLFQPKDRIFYGLFEKVVETNTLMGQKLKELVNTPDYSDRQVIINQIEALEHTNDENTHDIFTELGRNFITPFDREDIHALASSLDDIADYIHSASKKINFYKVDPMEQGFQKMAEVISQSTETLHGAVMELRNMKNVSNITSALVKINSLENQADDIYDMSIEKLFDSEPDVKEVIKKREIYQVMEIVTDKCEDAANVIESIIIKYA
jgi:predicted phosphate transport protein (TIGR00153 family)